VIRILESLDDLMDRLEQIKAEVVNLQAEAAGPGIRAAPRTAPRLPDLPNVILPTRTPDPDSIVGGKRVRRGDFPDCCAVGDGHEYYCSGTLIAPNVVVTAKHCQHVSRVFLNGNDISQPDGAEVINVKMVKDENGVDRRLAFPHPDGAVDLQVLVLEQDSIVPPRRVAQTSDLGDMKEVMLVGFGTIDLAGTVGYGIKRQVRVPFDTLDCTEADIATNRGCRKGYEIVAGHRGLRRDTCRGDSGGPLYIEARDGSYLLLGATSRGTCDSEHTCGDGGIYVRVDMFLDWIREVTGAEI
jgi:hypothetical protein